MHAVTEQRHAISNADAEQTARVAYLVTRLQHTETQIAARREVYNDLLRNTSEWNQADGTRNEMMEATKETRKEIKELIAAAREIVSKLEAARELESLKHERKTIKRRIESAINDAGQMFLALGAACGVEE